MTTFSIDSATSQQLRDYASDTLAMDVPSNIKDDTLRQRIREKLGEVQKGEEPKKTKANPEQYIWVRISNSGKDSSPVSLTHNGVQAVLLRNTWVEVPYKYFEVLRLAVTYDIDQSTGEASGRPTFPYQWSLEKPTEDFQKMSFA